jgi:hypothetical protein
MFNFGDIEGAFLFVSSGPYGENEAYLNVKTGEILYRSDMGDIDEIDDDTYWEQMIEIPHKNDLDLGTALVFEFAASSLPDEYDRVRDIFRRRGAYGRSRICWIQRGCWKSGIVLKTTGKRKRFFSGARRIR